MWAAITQGDKSARNVRNREPRAARGQQMFLDRAVAVGRVWQTETGGTAVLSQPSPATLAVSGPVISRQPQLPSRPLEQQCHQYY